MTITCCGSAPCSAPPAAVHDHDRGRERRCVHGSSRCHPHADDRVCSAPSHHGALAHDGGGSRRVAQPFVPLHGTVAVAVAGEEPSRAAQQIPLRMGETLWREVDATLVAPPRGDPTFIDTAAIRLPQRTVRHSDTPLR